MAATTEKYIFGAEATQIAGVALANAQNALGPVYNNVQGGGGGDGYPYARLKFIQTFTVAAAVNTALLCWFLKSSDVNLTYEDGATGAGYTPIRDPDFTIRAIPETGQARTIEKDVLLPANFLKLLVRNPVETGQALTALTVTLTPFTKQSV